MGDLPFDMPEFEAGSVWLAGAGPGDPGLLSLIAWHGLTKADVVVYDALVGDDILKGARAEAELLYAGKRGGKPSPKQDDISKRLIELARDGKRVLRLKGGDPFVFGRGGEEAQALVAAKVPFRIVPGISASVGGLAYAGIPLTHRDTNSVVSFLTGHDAQGVTPTSLNWDAIANGSQVLVLYMALRNLADISERLQAAGRSPDEPVALVSRATFPDQKVVVTTLAKSAEEVDQVKTPVLVVIGETVRFRDELD
ncbi:MAG TPA: uroporphyrinogen-III C-methyltransferase, partial [Rhodospirillaceae bacterium]|nr:uroporphyrinogen-III C-methyltransferase [Rhodospirillaceae bacterium]